MYSLLPGTHAPLQASITATVVITIHAAVTLFCKVSYMLSECKLQHNSVFGYTFISLLAEI
jgi:hypothetical protein